MYTAATASMPPAPHRPRPVSIGVCALLVALGLPGCLSRDDDPFCDAEGCGFSLEEWRLLATLANPDDPPPDRSNRLWNNPAARRLGKKFFFDPRFSGDATNKDPLRRTAVGTRAPSGTPVGISCATCHDLTRSSIDVSSRPGHISIGAGATDVNASGVVNAVYQPVLFWNGRADSLWGLNAVVAESGTTLNGNRLKTAHILLDNYRSDPDFEAVFGTPTVNSFELPPQGKPGAMVGCQGGVTTEPFADVFDCLPDELRGQVTELLVDWAKAIAAYEHQLISRNSAFDRYVSDGPTSTALSVSARRGARLFVGKAACVQCHNGPMLSDGLFHNVGVPQVGAGVPALIDCPAGHETCDCVAGKSCFPWGAFDGLAKLQASKYLRSCYPTNQPKQPQLTCAFSDDPSDDSRRAQVRRLPDEAEKGAWRTPSLRDVALTAPYMHDGALADLGAVVAHYNSGARWISGPRVGTVAPEIKPLLLTEGEQADLIAFLESLTGAPLPAALTTPTVFP